MSPRFLARKLWYRLRYGRVGNYLAHAQQTPGWTQGAEALALARASSSLPPGATIVEIGSFLGASAIMLAGARKLRGSGIVHCVDPFDSSGDAYSIPFYQALTSQRPQSQRQQFERNIQVAGVASWIQIHQGTAEQVAKGWSDSIDLLFLDGDQSPAGARSCYESWAPFLRVGGIIAVHNSSTRDYADGHDGSRRIVEAEFKAPRYTDISVVASTTYARRSA